MPEHKVLAVDLGASEVFDPGSHELQIQRAVTASSRGAIIPPGVA